MTQTQKRKARARRRIGRALYRALVGLSLVIVVVFCAFKLAVRTPAQKPALAAQAGTATDNPDTADIDESKLAPSSLTRKEEYYTFLLAASDDGNGNADTIMLLSYDVKAQKVGVVSIPRDTLVDTTRSSPKLNAAYGGGPEELESAVRDLVGFPIDYYLTVDMNAFKALVDTVGGVDFYVPINMNYDDPTQDLSIHFTEGMRHLDGQEALEVARFRKNSDGTGYPDSDISRTATQQKLLTAMAKKVLSWSSISKIKDFTNIFASYVKTDLSAGDMSWFAAQAPKVDPDAGVTCATLPGDGTVHYRGASWCYQLDPDETLNILNRLVNPYTTDLTPDMLNILQVK